MSDATMTLTTADAPTKPRNARLTARLVLAALALFAIGGGWYGYERARGTAGIPMATAGDFLPDASGPRGGFGGGFGGNRPPRPGLNADGVNVLPGNVVTVRADGLILRAAGRPDGKWTLNFTRPGNAGADRQAVVLVNLTRRRILEPKRPAVELKVTDAQRAALASVVPESPAELSPDAFKRAGELLSRLTKLPPTDAKAEPLKSELQAIVAAAAKADANAIAGQYDASAAKVRAILSADQLQALLGTTPPKPTVAPATRPAGK